MTGQGAAALAVLPDRPIDVDPSAFAAASAVMGHQVADQLAAALSGLAAQLAGTAAMGGSDPGGVRWATAYDEAAAVAAGGVADLANACHAVAALLAQSGFNHAAAEAASNPGGPPPPPDTTDYTAVPAVPAPALPSASGGSVGPPSGWGMIARLVGYVWPDGNPATLRSAAAAWSTAADAVRAASAMVPTAVAAIRSVQSPEIDDAVVVCQNLGAQIDDVATACRDLASACVDYADRVEECHRGVEDELVSLVAGRWRSKRREPWPGCSPRASVKQARRPSRRGAWPRRPRGSARSSRGWPRRRVRWRRRSRPSSPASRGLPRS